MKGTIKGVGVRSYIVFQTKAIKCAKVRGWTAVKNEAVETGRDKDMITIYSEGKGKEF